MRNKKKNKKRMQSQDSYNESIENNQKLVEQKKSSIMETNKMVEKNIQQTLPEHIKNILIELNDGLYEKERSIRLTLLAVLAGESTFMLGEPGTAKSLIARRISEAFEDTNNKDEIKFFDYLMNQFSQPDEIFGPISVQELKNDNYKRKTSKYLPKAQFAFLDEIWKANPAIQNALLTILNEKLFRNGGEMERVPLIGFMSASNELPAKNQGLDAIFDRFLVRILERPIYDENNFREMISAEKNPKINITERLSISDITKIQSEAEKVELSDDCFNVIQAVRKIVSEKNNENNREADERYIISDRRWKKIVNLMRMSAYCNGRTETDLMDASLIADCIWSTISQEQEAKEIIQESIEHFGMEYTTDFDEWEQKVKNLKTDIDKNFFDNDIYLTFTVNKSGESVEFYVLEDSNGGICSISVNPVPGNRWDTEEYYLFDDEVRISSSKVKFDEKAKKVKINNKTYMFQPTPKDLEKITLKAASDCFDKIVNDIKNSINGQINQIDQDMEKLGNQLKSNLFANSDLYYDIIFKEQINMKTQYDQLIKHIDVQQSRYKKLLEE